MAAPLTQAALQLLLAKVVQAINVLPGFPGEDFPEAPGVRPGRSDGGPQRLDRKSVV